MHNFSNLRIFFLCNVNIWATIFHNLILACSAFALISNIKQIAFRGHPSELYLERLECQRLSSDPPFSLLTTHPLPLCAIQEITSNVCKLVSKLSDRFVLRNNIFIFIFNDMTPFVPRTFRWIKVIFCLDEYLEFLDFLEKLFCFGKMDSISITLKHSSKG